MGKQTFWASVHGKNWTVPLFFGDGEVLLLFCSATGILCKHICWDSDWTIRIRWVVCWLGPSVGQIFTILIYDFLNRANLSLVSLYPTLLKFTLNLNDLSCVFYFQFTSICLLNLIPAIVASTAKIERKTTATASGMLQCTICFSIDMNAFDKLLAVATILSDYTNIAFLHAAPYAAHFLHQYCFVYVVPSIHTQNTCEDARRKRSQTPDVNKFRYFNENGERTQIIDCKHRFCAK